MVQKRKLDLISAELVTLVYIAITSVMIVVFWPELSNPLKMVGLRVIAISIMVITHLTYKVLSPKLALAWRSLSLCMLLIWWYPEIYDFCSLFPYLDHVFAHADQVLFGCQPSLEFDKYLSSTFWSEMFNMGYYSYYYMMFAVLLFYLIFRVNEYDKASFIFLASFFLFYFIYEFLPVAGPQYYFRALQDIYGEGGWRNNFPAVGDYFKTHTDMLTPEVKGIFSKLVISAQEIGERPEAAYPSSHVGMSTICMLLAWRTGNKWLFWILVPFYFLLCIATVYIKAHYLVDSISGLFFAVFFFYLTNIIYDHFVSKIIQ